MMKKNTFLSLILTLFIATNFLGQTTRYVSSSGNDTTGNGSVSLPYATIGKAVSETADGDIIRIIGDLSISGSNDLDLGASANSNTSFTIEGDPTMSTLTGTDGTASKFFILNGGSTNVNVTLKNIIFTGSTNVSGADGGALLINQGTSSFTIDNCVFSGNSHLTGKGGAISSTNGDLTITNTTFYDNSATKGGAIFVSGSNAEAIITNCTFFQNTISLPDKNNGAAIRVEASATVTVTNSLMYNNKANNGAGAESGFNSTPNGITTATNSLIGYANNTDTTTGSNIAADLTNSSLTWNATLNKVTYIAPNALTDDTPIDFGNDNEDVGAWDSKINIFNGGDAGGAEGWVIPANWSSGAVPIATENVAILTGRNCTLADNVTINDIKVTSLLKINSTKALIVNGESTVTGTVRHFVQLTDGAGLLDNWHLVASPVSGEVFDTTFADKNDIAQGTGSNRGIARYNPGQIGAAAWTYFTGADVNATSGQGFSMKITPEDVTAGEFANNLIGFEGGLNTADVTTESLTAGFNLLGSPYTSYMNSGTFLGDTKNTSIDQSQIWTYSSGTGYTARVSGDNFVLAPGQGFFVNSTGGTVTFAQDNQSLTGATFQKSARTEVKLFITDGTNNRYAKLYFLDNASNGYDFGWEGEVFGGVSHSLSVFTELVANSQGKKYQLQSLPKAEMENTVIPLGIKADAGKEITFSSETTNLPAGLKVFIEDRDNNTFTELTASETLKVTLNSAVDGIGRFYVHTTSSALNVDDIIAENVSIYKTSATNLRMVGLAQGDANVKLFNILGKQILNESFKTNGATDITLPKLATGVYIVQLETVKGKLNKKIILE